MNKGVLLEGKPSESTPFLFLFSIDKERMAWGIIPEKKYYRWLRRKT
jgi:hypothetical protein